MIVDIEKQPTWTSLITDLEIGEDFKAPYSRRLTIAPLISKIKREHQFRNRVFETLRIDFEGKEVLKVTRLKDKPDN